MPLTDAVIRRRKPQGKPFKLSDGRGLYLIVRPSGARWWRFRYRFAGKAKTLSVGVYPDVTLEMARERREALRRQVAAGDDPSVLRKAAALAALTPSTFEAVARDWLARQKRAYAPSTIARVTLILNKHIFPAIGRLPIGTIEPPLLLAALESVEHGGRYETAHRAKQLCGQVFRYAIVRGLATRDPTADLKGALQPVLTTHHAALTDPKAVGALLRLIDSFPGSDTLKTALRLAPLVFVRPGELRRAEWDEFDLEAAIWRVPEGKVKTRTAHLVPLSTQAAAILAAWLAALDRPSRYVFPHPRTKLRPMSDAALTSGLRRLGYAADEMTPHGFRAMARTLLDEVLRFQPDVIEVQLGHVVRGSLGATYNRSAYWEQRVTMMQAWSDYLDGLKANQSS